MSSIKDRQRAAARARLEKEMAERAAAARKRRQRQAIIGSAIAVVVIAGGAIWLVSALNKGDDKTAASGPPAGTVACTWTPVDAASPSASVLPAGRSLQVSWEPRSSSMTSGATP